MTDFCSALHRPPLCKPRKEIRKPTCARAAPAAAAFARPSCACGLKKRKCPGQTPGRFLLEMRNECRGRMLWRRERPAYQPVSLSLFLVSRLAFLSSPVNHPRHSLTQSERLTPPRLSLYGRKYSMHRSTGWPKTARTARRIGFQLRPVLHRPVRQYWVLDTRSVLKSRMTKPSGVSIRQSMTPCSSTFSPGASAASGKIRRRRYEHGKLELTPHPIARH